MSSVPANDQLVGNINASRSPLRRPWQASTSMSPTGKHVPRIHPCGAVWFIPEQEQLEKNRIAEAQKKRAARKVWLYSTTSTSAGPTYPCPECGRVQQVQIWLISHLRTHRANQSWNHHNWRSWAIPSWSTLRFQRHIVLLLSADKF